MNANQATDKKDREPHVLDDMTFVKGPTWPELKKLWHKPPCSELMWQELRMSILHYGFISGTNGKEDELDRVAFYLKVADRYDLPEAFFDGNNDTSKRFFTNFGYLSAGKLQLMIARQAFKSLCEGFFKENGEYGYTHTISLAITPALFARLLWFFRRRRVDCDNNTNLHPMSGSDGLYRDVPEHYIRTLQKFARTFCRAAWHYSDYAEYVDSVTERFRLDTHERLRHSVIQVLDIMERLDMLDTIACNQGLCDRETFNKLSQHVLDQKLWLKTPIGGGTGSQMQQVYRKPKNLEEASVATKLAEVLLKVKAKLDYPQQ
ncbi:MAG: hypothetical protein WCT19_03435 [Candidatus Paceibacterota bacterium]